MEKDSTYYSSAIQYNEILAEAAEGAAGVVEHPEIQKWCIAVGRQHRFHAKRHTMALAKLEEGQSQVQEPELVGDGLDVPELTVAEQQAEFAKRHETEDDEPDTNFHDSKTGQFVSEEYAEAHPETTVQVTEKDDGPADIAIVASRMDESTPEVQFSNAAGNRTVAMDDIMPEDDEGMYYNARGESITKQQYDEENA